MTGAVGSSRKRSSALAQQHDCLLVDLDGTVVRGAEPVDGAVESLRSVDARVLFVTNNASRSAGQVAERLRALGFDAGPDDVVTSAQGAARLLATQLPPSAPVLVVGTEELSAEIDRVGLRPVRRWADNPVAVVQGYSPHTGWPDLAEAALAIRGGALWVATNLDPTLPSERGLLPGNGSLVAALRVATDHEPRVAGKPEPTLLADALQRGAFRSPLVIGDRLDTDIAAANSARLPSLLVLSGATTARDVIAAAPGRRPSYLGHDLRALQGPPATLRIGRQRGWRVDVDRPIDKPVVTVSAQDRPPADDGLSAVRAVADAVWQAGLDPHSVELVAGDDAAQAALHRCSLL